MCKGGVLKSTPPPPAVDRNFGLTFPLSKPRPTPVRTYLAHVCIHTCALAINSDEQIHDILKAEKGKRERSKLIKKCNWSWRAEMRNVKAIAWIYHSLGATLCTSMFNICLLQCVIEYIYFANAKLSSRLSLCDAPPLGNRREDLQLETSLEPLGNLWPCRSCRFFLGRDNLRNVTRYPSGFQMRLQEELCAKKRQWRYHHLRK